MKQKNLGADDSTVYAELVRRNVGADDPARPQKRNTQKGITLIALIISIIVMLILAVVSINIIMNQGIMTKSKDAADTHQVAAEKEAIQLGYTEYLNDKYNGETNLTLTVADANVQESENEWIITFNAEPKNVYKLSKNGGEPDGPITGDNAGENGYTYIKKSTKKEDSYVGYYADIDKDGKVDGVIFVDLLTGSIKEEQKWTNDSGVYTLPTNVTESNVNTYYISAESYTDPYFGPHPVISPKDTNGEKRFYVMSLSNFETERKLKEDGTEEYPAYTEYYWYKNANGKMNASDTSVDFGAGKSNTGKMIGIWNKDGGVGGYSGATQDNQDIWKHIQTRYNEGWFIPSRAEWSAFANELGITSSNYGSTYGLSNAYFSSSQGNTLYVWIAGFDNGCMGINTASSNYYVRLATTF